MKSSLKDFIIGNKAEVESRALSVSIKIKNKIVEIWNIYTPNRNDLPGNYFKKLFRETDKKGHIILGGDFNAILESDETSGEFRRKPYMGFLKDRMDR